MCVYVCVFARVHAYVCGCVSEYVGGCLCLYVCVCTPARVCVRTCACVYANMCACEYMRQCERARIYVPASHDTQVERKTRKGDGERNVIPTILSFGLAALRWPSNQLMSCGEDVRTNH